MSYKQLTNKDIHGFTLDLDTDDNVLCVWNDERNGYGEWPAYDVYLLLKAYFGDDK